MTLHIFSAITSPSEPPKTVKSWEKTQTRRPSMSPWPGDDGVAPRAVLLHVELERAVANVGVELLERAGVEQLLDALARRVLALRVLLLDGRLGSVVDRGVTQLLELGELLLVCLRALLAHGRGGYPPRAASSARTAGGAAAPSVSSTPVRVATAARSPTAGSGGGGGSGSGAGSGSGSGSGRRRINRAQNPGRGSGSGSGSGLGLGLGRRLRLAHRRLGGQRDPRAPARGLEPHAAGSQVALPFDDRLGLRARDADLAELAEVACQRPGVGDLRPQLRG
jgi:hypothetical protein